MAREVIGDSKALIETGVKDAPVKDILWSATQLEAQSDTHLEDDKGDGGAAIIRMYEFKANPQAFKEHKPTKQELFNTHHKAIEALLWGDGLKIMTEVNPRVTVNKKGSKYRIFVGAVPQRGHALLERPQTLSEITKKQ